MASHKTHFNLLTIHWHTVCLFVYLLIVVSDFLLFPMWTEFMNHGLNPDKLVELSLKFDQPASQLAVMQSLNKIRTWEPLTLLQNGMFHMAFGAILGIGAWKRTKKDGEADWPLATPGPTPGPVGPPPAPPHV